MANSKAEQQQILSLAELHGEQTAVLAAIQEFVTNYELSRQPKIIERLERELSSLDTMWSQFEERDLLVRSTFGKETDHEYFSNDVHATAYAMYAAMREKIVSDISNVSVKQSPNDISHIEPNVQILETEEHQASNMHVNLLKIKQAKIIERIRNSLTDIIADDTHQSVHFYTMNIKSIERHWDTVQTIHRQIVEMMDISCSMYDMDKFFDTEEQILKMMLEVHGRSQSSVTTSQPPSSQSSSRSKEHVNQFRMPRIEIPKFNGDYLKWRQFRDLFTELVANQHIPPCQKLWYLKSCVTDEAEILIRHISIANDNYDTAWSIINNRYENKRLLVNAIITKLLSQPITSNESISSLKSLHDTTRECLLALKGLDIDTHSWDPMLLHILVQRLHKTTHSLWEQSLVHPRELPSLESFLTYIEKRFQALEAIGLKQNIPIRDRRSDSHSLMAMSASIDTSRCIECNEHHPLFKCSRFLAMSPKNRLNLIQRFKHCANCMKFGHRTHECKSRNCIKCNKKHNTLLHFESISDNGSVSKSTEDTTAKVSLVTSPIQTGCTTTAILSTILVNVTDKSGNQIECRALLDSGSQANFVTQRLIRKLGLRKTPSSIDVEGIGQTARRINERANILVCSKINNFSAHIDAHILPTIVSQQPSQLINITNWTIPKNIKLADPKFHEPRNIDLLIGAGLFYTILSVGQIKLGERLPVLQNTLFGWVVGGEYSDDDDRYTSTKISCGVGTTAQKSLDSTIEKFWILEDDDKPVKNVTCTSTTISCAADEESLNALIERFWRLEECDAPGKNFTAAEKRVEDHFLKNVRRDHDGRFIVKLPFNGDPSHLGESQSIAMQRFESTERRLTRNADLRRQYVEFMRNFIEKGYMEPVDLEKIKGPCYFLPHHCVLKPTSSTTKLRVVFDASAKTSTNLSLNDVLATGPTLQSDVFTILLRFRLPLYAFAADVEQMYPQVKISAEDRKYLLFWWREDSTELLQPFQLTTVTFGTTSAPFLATRCLLKLAEEEEKSYPLGAKCIRRNFYVDDVLAGADQIHVALKKQSQLIEILKKGGFHLRKWCANDPRLLENIPVPDQELQLNFDCPQPGEVKTMGLIWNPKTDVFSTKITPGHSGENVTKRIACSDIARLFDPLGFYAPVVTLAKIFLRTLWKLKIHWDAALPQDLHTSWIRFRDELFLLHDVSIPRHVFGNRSTSKPQVHIFTDASEDAYGAVAYVRSVDADNITIVRFLCAKSRVAPPKQVSIPRLELCGAKLGANMKHRIQKDLNLSDDHFYMWSDSTCVLGWIKAQSSNYYTFVANRISAIQQLTNPQQWRFVKTFDNPADFISRGLTPGKLINNNFWFYGPMFLHGSDSDWTNEQSAYEVCTLEMRQKTRTVLVADFPPSSNVLERIDTRNSFKRLQRVVAYILRFANQTRRSKRIQISSLSPTADEMECALVKIIISMQRDEFAEEIKQIKKYKSVDRHNSLSSLAPLMDKDDVLRVGGRLESSLLSYDAKHPMLLPYNHPITKLIIMDLHNEHLHAGPQALLSIVRQRFWPIKGKTIVRAVVKSCVTCSRANPQLLQQFMGNLPAERVQPSRPFVNTGVDFLGPVWTHFQIKGKRPQKAYVAVFCCFASKAVHMELVSDLSTDAFLGALKRFMARRGQCRKIICDNATNFVGASNQLQELQQTIHSRAAQDRIVGECSRRNIEFSFIPPRAPHFGGLWEAAVKSAKHLLRSTIASAALTYEEMQTLLAEAEAILNSRPLTPMSTDPNDITPLTPGHLLIGEPLTSTVDPHAAPNNAGLLARWKLVAHLKAEFWKRWSHEYLNHLQHRYKWKSVCNNAEPGMMVIIKEDNLPPLKWSLGRIERVIRGEDGLVRVADVRTASNVVRRSIHRLAPLPVEGSLSLPDDEVSDNLGGKRSCPATSSHQASSKRCRR